MKEKTAKPFIIAELGINHNGDLDTAKKLIDMAKDCGCDAVKFQKRTIEIVYTKELLDSHRESPWGNTQRAQKEGLELGKKEYDIIDKYCKEKEILWFASAWDTKSQEFLQQYNLNTTKLLQRC
jgi:N-acetylneuraminate synthase